MAVTENREVRIYLISECFIPLGSIDIDQRNVDIKSILNKRKKRSKRGPLMIIISILDKLDGESLNKTHLSYRTNLDIRVLNRYLTFMYERRLIVYNDKSTDPTVVRITDKGKNVLYHFKQAIRLIDEKCDVDNRCMLRTSKL